MSRLTRLRISSESDAALAVMEATRVARALGYDLTSERTIATAVSELVRNILKYAGMGEVLFEEIQDERRSGLQITVRDQGPGIADLETAMRDHYSSGGTLGLGLPGVRRMMDDFEIKSAVGRGTTIVVRKWRAVPRHRTPGAKVVEATAKKRPSKIAEASKRKSSVVQPAEALNDDLDYSFYVRPYRGERVSGDDAIVRKRGNLLLLGVIDGLGHGMGAFGVARQAKAFLSESWRPDPVATLSLLHETLKGSIGAAAGIGVLDLSSGILSYAGIGNTSARVFGSSRTLRLGSTAGTLGHQVRKPKEYQVELSDRDLLIFHTDGITERFEMTDYPQMKFHRAKTVARNLVRLFGKDHDDATCLALRYSR